MKKVITIEGMSCRHCQANVENVLNSINGISDAKVDLNSKTATIEISGKDLSDEVLLNAIKEIGYKPTSIH